MQFVIAQEVVDGGVPHDLDFGIVKGPLLHDFAGAKFVTTNQQMYLAGELGQKCRFLDGTVATTDDGNFLTSEEEPVAGCTGRQTVTHQTRFGSQAKHQALGAR